MSSVELVKSIIAAVVTKDGVDRVGGGLPVFIAETRQEQEHVAFLLSRILDAMAHDLENGTLIIVKH